MVIGRQTAAHPILLILNSNRMSNDADFLRVTLAPVADSGRAEMVRVLVLRYTMKVSSWHSIVHFFFLSRPKCYIGCMCHALCMDG